MFKKLLLPAIIQIIVFGLLSSGVFCDEATEQVTILVDQDETVTEQLRADEGEKFDGDDNGKGKEMQHQPYDLPADAESIRTNIIDSQFSCDEKDPGYYADVENDCQIFHRCLEGRSEIYSFICPEKTLFDQRVLVCIWENNYNFDCGESAKYFQESNRAFLGNITAEESLMENIMNSQEIKNNQLMLQSLNEKKLFDENLSSSSEKSESESESTIEQGIEDSNDYQAELIPNLISHEDASIVTSADSKSEELPQKIMLFADEPIIEFSAPAKLDDDTATLITNARNIRKRSKLHGNRFLFRADTVKQH